MAHDVIGGGWRSRLRRLAALLLALAACNSSELASADSAKRVPAASPAPLTPAANQERAAVERVVVDNVALTLRDCSLTVEAPGAQPRTELVDLPSKCAFGRLPDGKVQVRRTTQGATVLLISSLPDPRRAGDCITRARAVVVTERGDAKISFKEKSWASCGVVGPFDEPMFIVLARSIP